MLHKLKLLSIFLWLIITII